MVNNAAINTSITAAMYILASLLGVICTDCVMNRAPEYKSACKIGEWDIQ